MKLDADSSLKVQFAEQTDGETIYFIALFSRFEHAMKRGGYLRENRAEPAWDALADTLDGEFWEQFIHNQNTKLLYEDPPRQLRLENGNNGDLIWATYKCENRGNRDLLKRVKTVRNNLFHGDKTSDCDRDLNLVSAAISVLETLWHATDKNPDFKCFREAFCGYIQIRREDEL